MKKKNFSVGILIVSFGFLISILFGNVIASQIIPEIALIGSVFALTFVIIGGRKILKCKNVRFYFPARIALTIIFILVSFNLLIAMIFFIKNLPNTLGLFF